jgi:hypothetical protein
MKGESTWRPLCALASAVLLLAACSGSSSSRATPDDATVHRDITSGQSGVEVTFDGTLKSDPEQVGTHEHLSVTTPDGDVLEVDHNTTLAPWVPGHTGDHVIVHGRLYIDPGPRAGVHCTHSRTSSGCPQPGWVELGGNYYE